MNVTMNQVEGYMGLFHQLQEKHNAVDRSNIIQNKWNMRSVAMQMPNKEDLVQLIKFFMLFSEDRTYEYFFWNYDKFYEEMLRTREDRLRRRYLQEKTLKDVAARKEKEGSVDKS